MKSNYVERLMRLKQRKLEQTAEKIRVEGLLDEDDYGRVVPPEGLWNIKPNHEDGSFYGFDAWTDNFCSLMDVHPVYVDPDDAFAGRWMYFMSKMRPNKWNPDYPYDHLKENIRKYDIICGIGDDAHFAPDYAMGLELGWGGIKEKLLHWKGINTLPEQQHFYDIHLRAVTSVQGWIARHIEQARSMAASESDPDRRSALEEIAKTNEAIIENPPSTLRQACQWIIWYHLASRTYNRDGAGGQIDALLKPYYEKDLAEGRIDKDTAVYYLACFLINDPIYWQLGGPDENGVDQTSEISYLILDAADRINTSLNITVRVHDGLDKGLMRKAVECLVRNKNGWPRFSGDQALVEGFARNGFPESVARQRIAVGCNWMSLPGLEYTMNDLVKVNMAKIFEVAFKEKEEFNGTADLWDRFVLHLRTAVHTAAEGIRHHLAYQRYNEPELLLNLLSHGPIEKALDASAGGATYYNMAIDGAGLAVVADSFAAIQEQVEDKATLTWDALCKAVKADFQGEENERTRLVLRKTGRYGKEGSKGQAWAERIRGAFSDAVKNESGPGRCFIPGFFSWANTVGFGSAVGATPDGRHAGTPISHGANPMPGFVEDGASLSLAKAIAAVQPGYGNTAPMQWEIDPGMAKEDKIEVIEAIIRAHFRMGGTLINVNVMDRDKILEAHRDPSLHPDLVVSVTGFTAYFSMLSPEFRQLVVDRILMD